MTSFFIRSSPVRIAASRNAKTCRSMPADFFMTVGNAARGCAPKKETAACSARSARSPARRSRASAFTDKCSLRSFQLSVSFGHRASPAELIQCVGINNELFPPLTACPICDARWLYMLRVSFGPIVMMRSCVRVRPAKKNVPLVFAETFTNFQVGVTFPFDTMTNFTSYETVSGFGPLPAAPFGKPAE